MIAKVEVRRELALYEKKIKEEIKRIEDEIEKMDSACATNDIKEIWRASAKYTTLRSRKCTLTEIVWGIADIRCGEMLDDAT